MNGPVLIGFGLFAFSQEVKMAAVTQQEIEATVRDAATNMAHRYVSAYRETLLTNSQIVAAMTADARSSGFSVEYSAEMAECVFKHLEQNHHPLIREANTI